MSEPASQPATSARRTGVLIVGVLIWLCAVAMTPSELAAAKRRDKIGARTAATMILYLAAAILVLHGAPRRVRA